MKILHTIILFALVNFFITISLVFAFKDPDVLTKSTLKGNNTSDSIVVSSPSPSSLPSKTSQPVQIITPTAVPNSTVSPTTNNSLCIITIDGQKYNVTDFRRIHGGGDVFTCGTDMTNIFYSRHDSSYLARMAQYKLP